MTNSGGTCVRYSAILCKSISFQSSRQKQVAAVGLYPAWANSLSERLGTFGVRPGPPQGRPTAAVLPGCLPCTAAGTPEKNGAVSASGTRRAAEAESARPAPR